MSTSKYKREDHLYKLAKQQGYRSRAAYKLLELQKKHNIIRPRASVIELGCWPGSWLQVAAELVGEQGQVIGIDLQAIEPLPFPQIQFFQGDAGSPEMLQQIQAACPNGCDVLLSDMAPKLSGIKEMDRAAVLNCAQIALDFARDLLKGKGEMLLKVFKSPESEGFVKSLRPIFNKVTRLELNATRQTSNEFYILASDFKSARF